MSKAESDVLFVPDLADRLGRTEAAIRTAIHRGSDSIPRPFRLGSRWAWRKTDYDNWLAKKAGAQ